MNETGVFWGIPGASGGILEHLNPNFPPTKEGETIAFFFWCLYTFSGKTSIPEYSIGGSFSPSESIISRRGGFF